MAGRAKKHNWKENEWTGSRQEELIQNEAQRDGKFETVGRKEWYGLTYTQTKVPKEEKYTE